MSRKMDLPNGYKDVKSIRGIHYDPKKGLFLIQTEKSKIDKKWTTPGRHMSAQEDSISGLTNAVFNEIGVNITGIKPSFIYQEQCLLHRDKERLTVEGYLIDLPVIDGGRNEGLTKTNLPFKFFNIIDLFRKDILLTRNTYRIMYSPGFLEKVSQYL